MPICAACGASGVFGAAFCASCGAPQDHEFDSETTTAGPAGKDGGTLGAKLRRLPLGVVVASVALVVGFIGLVLPWLTANALYIVFASEDGFNSWGWLSFVALLGGIAVVLAHTLGHTGGGTGRAGALSDSLAGRLVLVAGGAELFGVVLFWVSTPSGSLAVHIGVGAGLKLCLVASLGVIAGGALLASPALSATVRKRLWRPPSD